MAGDENSKKQKKTGAPNSRDARLAAALRENLRRRKAQERGRGSKDDKAAGGQVSGEENP